MVKVGSAGPIYFYTQKYMMADDISGAFYTPWPTSSTATAPRAELLRNNETAPNGAVSFCLWQGDHFIRTFMHIPLHLNKIAVI